MKLFSEQRVKEILFPLAERYAGYAREGTAQSADIYRAMKIAVLQSIAELQGEEDYLPISREYEKWREDRGK